MAWRELAGLLDTGTIFPYDRRIRRLNLMICFQDAHPLLFSILFVGSILLCSFGLLAFTIWLEEIGILPGPPTLG
jgi:hypothetical protein